MVLEGYGGTHPDQLEVKEEEGIADYAVHTPNMTSQYDRRESDSGCVDFETALTMAGFGKFNYLMLLIAIPASCTNAFVTGAMSFVVPVAGRDLGLTPISKALLQSAPYAGMIISGYFWGVLSDSYGRQRLIVVGFLLDFLMNSLCALIPYLPTILAFKFLSGFMVCGPFSIFMAYVSEIFLAKRRDLAVLSSGIFGCTLTAIQVCLAMAVIPADPLPWLPFKSWQLFIFCCGIPGLITGAATAFSVESPKFLADKGQTEAALRVCRRIYSINTGLPPDTFPVKEIKKPLTGASSSKKVSLRSKVVAATSGLRPPYINRLLLVFGIQLALAMTLNLIRLWLPEMLTVMANADPVSANQSSTLCPLLAAGHKAEASSLHVSTSDNVYYNMIILNLCCLAAQVIFIFVVKFIGKKFIIMGVASIAVGCTISMPNINSAYISVPASLTVAALTIAFYSQVGLIVEIFPTSIRATSVSLTFVCGRIGVLTGNFLIANLMYSYCEYMFYTLSLFCVGIVVACLLLDTTPFEGSSKEDKRIRHETM